MPHANGEGHPMPRRRGGQGREGRPLRRDCATRAIPAELARRYDEEGADEVVFLDITASSEERATMVDVVARSAEQVFIPLTVGGGVRSVRDAMRLLRAGADKVAVNTAAVEREELVGELAAELGTQCVVVAIDARSESRVAGQSEAATRSSPTVGAARPESTCSSGRAVARQQGAGEILLTSMDRDGTRLGYDIELTRAVSDAVRVPVIASGGVGTLDHLVDGAIEGGADAPARRLDLPLAGALDRRGEVPSRGGGGSCQASGVIDTSRRPPTRAVPCPYASQCEELAPAVGGKQAADNDVVGPGSRAAASVGGRATFEGGNSDPGYRTGVAAPRMGRGRGDRSARPEHQGGGQGPVQPRGPSRSRGSRRRVRHPPRA